MVVGGEMMAFVVDGMGIVCGWSDNMWLCYWDAYYSFFESRLPHRQANGKVDWNSAAKDRYSDGALVAAPNSVSSAMHMQGERTLSNSGPSCHRPIVLGDLPSPRGVRRIGCFPCNDVAPTRGDQHLP